MAEDKVRVAILGGGVGAMSAAFALTEIDPKGEKYDITVYQLGWRLGGKCADGRNAQLGQRIEEHGLHIWGGFYENSFTIMRIVFKALNQDIGQKFKRQNQIFYGETVGDQWLPWPFWMQPDKDPSVFPGRDDLWAPDRVMPPLSAQVRRALGMFIYSLEYYWVDWPGDQQAETQAALDRMPPEQRARLNSMSTSGTKCHPLLELVRKASAGLESDQDTVRHTAKADVFVLLSAFRDLLKTYSSLAKQPESGALRGLPLAFQRLLSLVRLGIAMILGMLKNDCLENGLEVLDQYDFTEFLAAQDPDVVNEPANKTLLTAFYEYVFGYKDGSRAQPQLSACASIQGLFRMFFTYKGAFFFKATSGMGDTVFAPLYRLLKQRGVSFKFFHKVTGLVPAADGSEIDGILIDQQVALVPGPGPDAKPGEYAPLIQVKGDDAWPETPLWDQVENGAALAVAGVNFEQFYGPPNPPQPPPVAKLHLRRGQDFDKIVLGISIGALGDLCRPLMDQKPAWKQMIDKLLTVRTQALQLWLNPKVRDLGGPYADAPIILPLGAQQDPDIGPIVANCLPPFDTYSDMSQVLPAEDWPANAGQPLSVAYFCSVMGDEIPNNEELTTKSVVASAEPWMISWLSHLWTGIGSGLAFQWDWLYVPSTISPQPQGAQRLLYQYWRANIDPSERYVLSLPGTMQYRLEPGQSGYGNLFLAGDWTRVPELNAGCVEAAAMSGLGAASALSGVYIPIVSTTPEPRITHDYIDYAGWITLPPAPAVGNDSTFYSFAFKADGKVLQDFLDRSYNRAAGYQRFRVMLDMVMLLIIQSRGTASVTPPFSQEGTMGETDIGFWLLVGNYEPGALLPKSIGLLPAYLFVDNAWAVAEGREVWGFPKYFATMIQPDRPPPSKGIFGCAFEASALAIPRFSPEARASVQPVFGLAGLSIQMEEIDPGLVGDTADTESGALVSPVDIFKRLFADADKKQLDDLCTNPEMPSFLDVAFTVFYLKQARSADSSTLAAYKALLEGKLELTNIEKMGFLPGLWTLELGQFDSLPLISDLGLGVPTDGKLVLKTLIGLWAQIDFATSVARPIG